jgi:hypothetical protein
VPTVAPRPTATPDNRPREFSVIISGTIDGSVPVYRQATLIVGPTQTTVTNNGINPADMCLYTGGQLWFATNPGPGVINFSTNSDCVPSSTYYTARVDVAYVSISGGTLTVHPDPNLTALGFNAYNITSGLTAGIEKIYSGTFQLTFYNSGQVVRGGFDIVGCSTGPGCTGTEYVANVSGTFVKYL